MLDEKTAPDRNQEPSSPVECDSELAPNKGEIKRFLLSIGRKRPTLCFKGERGFITKVYPTVKQAASAAAWFSKEGWEVYHLANSHRMNPDSNRRITKPAKKDIELCIGVGVDVDGVGADPEVIRELSDHLDWQPTYIVASGGGLQAFWKFDRHLTDSEDAEAINLWLIHEFAAVLGWDKKDGSGGVDKVVWNCDRVWRLPGTVNQRRQKMARLVGGDPDSRMPVDEAGRRERTVNPGEFTVNDWDWVNKEWMDEVFPPYLWDYLWADGNDRSAHVYQFLRKFFQALGMDDFYQEAAVAMLLIETDDPRFVSHHSYYRRTPSGFEPRRDPQTEAMRQVRKWIEKEGGDA